MIKIGKGSFSTAYLMDNGKVFIKSTDHIKECMAQGWFPSSRLFPKVEFGEAINTYIMKYYKKVTSLKNTLTEKDYAMYKELRVIANSLNYKAGYNELYEAFKMIKNRRVRVALQEALSACSNYGGDIGFEISPRNVAVNKGRLVLLDCFFIRSQLKEVRSR